MPLDIKENPLYIWAEATITELELLRGRVNTWTHSGTQQTEGADASLLAAKLDVALAQIVKLSEKLDAKFSGQFASPDDDGYETDKADERLLERKTKAYLAAEGHMFADSLWGTRPVSRKPGTRILCSDIALDDETRDEIRLSLYHFLNQSGNHSGAVTQETDPDDSTRLVVQLATRKKH
ncbi:MAG: hypothetical protein Q8L78_02480 [Coxiellaceae bacterium]|nr:hypothetical protein [Coxiellaceae bacterium]